MAFVERRQDAIVGVYANAQPGYAEEWLSDDDEEIGAFLYPPPPLLDLPRPAFLFMVGKIGVTEDQVDGLIGQMPDGTTEERDAKALALLVFRNQQSFKRDNSLLATLTEMAGLSSDAVDQAWRAAEQLTW